MAEPIAKDAPVSVFAALRADDTYKSLLVNPWTYVTGAVVLALFNSALLASTGKAWGVTTSFAYWGAWAWEAVGGSPKSWLYFNEVKPAFQKLTFLTDPGTLINLGVIVGALLACLLAGQFKIKKVKSNRQIVAAILGGLLMGLGARIAFGCNIGSLFSAIPSMSMHGWVFLPFMFCGAFLGSRLLVKYFM